LAAKFEEVNRRGKVFEWVTALRKRGASFDTRRRKEETGVKLLLEALGREGG